jgi:acyl transferase domain-containing protein/surfactin synthase thioesterase subunit/acyl carrier protein
MENKVSLPQSNFQTPIAIVGLACRFPKADTANAFWNMLSNGIDAVTEIPKDRWNVDEYFDADPTAINKTHQRHAAMLEKIHDFDPYFFNISPSEAIEMNPSQKLMLELAWETMENSSIPFKKLQGKKIGVYVGNIWSDFEHLRKHKNANVTSHSAVGQSSNIIANRISFTFGFRGPSLVMDTGCSSSLVAIHLACQSLWEGSTEAVMAGAVNHLLDPDQYILLSKFGGLSKKGKCSTFDKDADGFVRGEGAGMLLLKKLEDAERDGDKIYAVIRGIAMNNNGFNVNLPATSVQGQMEVLEEAYKNSGILPEEVHYVEAHGTGTRLGDPTESKALGTFFGKKRTPDKPLHVGSVKTNIGHLEGAAGIAGLIKVVLAMHHRMLPPNLNFNTPNPEIPFNELKLKVQNVLGKWPVTGSETLKAGINSFGWGGTNAHAVLEEYRPAIARKTFPAVITDRFLLPLSAKSESALKAYAKKYLSFLEREVDNSKESLQEVCVSSSIHKTDFDYRTVFTGSNKQEIIQKIQSFLDDTSDNVSGRPAGKSKLVFVFPGQGSQWLGMGKELYAQEPSFREVIDACDEAFRPYTDWSLIEQLHASKETSRLNEINVIQPALSAVQMALAALWKSRGVTPDTVVGHSMGEVAAAYVAGAITLDEAALIICTRSQLMKTVSGQGGAMAVTELTIAEAENLIKNYDGKLSIAVSNSPKSTVLAGDQGSIEKVLADLESRGLFGKQVKVDVASHSPQMDPLKAALFEALKNIKPQANHTTLYSTVQNSIIAGEKMDAAYWVSNLRGTVQFAGVIEQLLKDKHAYFVEVSPHPVLTNAVNECAEAAQAKAVTIPSTLRDKPEMDIFTQFFCDLYSKGFDVNWEGLYQEYASVNTNLPGYPFQREKYEIEDHSSERLSWKGNTNHPMLGRELTLAEAGSIKYWETEIGTGTHTFLKDHQVNGSPVLPGAAYLEMALAACDECWGKGNHIVEDLVFYKPVVFQDATPVTLQLKMTLSDSREAVIQFYSKPRKNEPWLLLAEGKARFSTRHYWQETASHPPVEKFKAGVRQEGRTYYESLESLGLQYGTYFQGVEEFWKLDNEVMVKIKLDDRIKNSKQAYRWHPVLADASFHALFANVLGNADKDSERTTFLTSIGNCSILQDINLQDELWVYAKLYADTDDENGQTIEVGADISLFTPGGNTLVQVTGLKGKVLDTRIIREQQGVLNNWLYKNTWLEQTPLIPKQFVFEEGCWLILGDTSGISTPLIKQFKKAGIEYIHVTYDGHYEQIKSSGLGYEELDFRINYSNKSHYDQLFNYLINTEKKKIAGIVHCASIYNHWSLKDSSADEILELQKLGSISLTYLLQSLESFKLTHLPKLAIVTNGTQHIGGEIEPSNVINGPLWGLSRVVANELSSYSCRRFDLSFQPSVEEIEILFTELIRTDATEDETAIRSKKRYVSRLSRYTDENYEWDNPEFSSEGTYLVTGFRGLGFTFVEWMFEHGARYFALLSRSGQASGKVWEKMQQLKERGAVFRMIEADVSDYSQLKSAFLDIESHMPSLKGIIHAAGLIEAKPILEHTWETFSEILEPKVKGAWNLHLLSQELPLDCFVLFSSASSLIGLSGQSSYVAANAFLDSLAYYRRQQGLQAISINWGVMKDVGMVADSAELEKYAKAEGFEAVNMTDALEVLSKIYKKAFTQIGIMKLDAMQCASYYSAMARTGYLSNLLQTNSNQQQQEGNFLESLLLAASKEAQLAAIEEQLIQQVARIIKAPVERIKNNMTFKGLGVDSLMAIQLRNQLEKIFKCKLSVTTLWTHPTITEYAVFLYETSMEQIKTVKKAEEKVGTDWFVYPYPNPKASIRLFCFHDAGGSSSLYQGWEQHLNTEVELVCVELPGRGKRINEPAYDDMSVLVKEFVSHFAEHTNKPFAFFGHSMGGALLFEVTRELRRKNMPLPVKMFVSSTPWLGSYDKQQVEYRLSETELIQRFPHLSYEQIKDKELQELLVNILKSDLKLLKQYQFQPEDAFEIPLIALHGKEDPRVQKDQINAWKNETKSSFRMISRDGGHRYIEHDSAFVARLVSEEVLQNEGKWTESIKKDTIISNN